MNQVEAMCDRVALIHAGRLMVYGEVDEVRRRYSLPEVRVHAERPLPAVPRCRQRDARGGRRLAAPARGRRRAADALAALVRAGRRVDRFEPVLAPMEDIFLRVVREEAGDEARWSKVRTVATFEFLTAVKRPGF